MSITKLPPLDTGMRPETGPMQFGNDYPGMFIRGDDALARAQMADQVLQTLPEEYLQANYPIRSYLIGLKELFSECRVEE